MGLNNKLCVFLVLCSIFNFYTYADAYQTCQKDPSSQQCAMTHPHFFFESADLSFDSKLSYQMKVSDSGAVGLSPVNSGSFKGSLNFTNWNPDNTSVPKDWVQNDILENYYSQYTNPVSWDGNHMKNTNGNGSRPAELRYAAMVSALQVKDQSNNASYVCRNVVIARGDDNWWVFQNDGKRPKDGPGLYCYLNSSSAPKSNQSYDIYLLGGDKAVDVDGEEVYKMKIRIAQHEE